MVSFRKALLYGFLIWLIPFLVAFLIFPLRQNWRALFESIMPVVVTIPTTFLGVSYLKGVARNPLREGIYIGLLWLGICLIIDMPLMLTKPINMTLVEYMADVGLTYLIIPTVTIGLGMALQGRVDTRT